MGIFESGLAGGAFGGMMGGALGTIFAGTVLALPGVNIVVAPPHGGDSSRHGDGFRNHCGYLNLRRQGRKAGEVTGYERSAYV